jgi:hypothetical protein
MEISISEEQKKKYYPTLNELTVSLKSALDLKTNLELILRYGLERLDFGMRQWAEVDKFPSFNHKKPYVPYDTKDLYFLATNAIYLRGPNQQDPWKVLPPCLGEIYFSYMVRRIREYENSHKNRNRGYRFNKGMVYANLGVTQASQKKMDEGFANILKALDEDAGYSKPEARRYALFRRELFSQFEKDYVIKDLSKYVSKLKIKNENEAPMFVKRFLKSLSADQRSFFDYNFARIMQNLDIWNDKENRFTSNRLLAYSQDLCLFAEDLLRRKEIEGRTLDKLIKKAFPKVRHALDNCGAKSMKELSKNLRNHFKETDLDLRCLRILLTLRNFSSHNIAGGTKASYFYKEYENVIIEIFRAIFKIYRLRKKSRFSP